MTIAPRRIALVGCGKSKLDRAAPARKLYTGQLFRAALRVAEAEFPDNVWILSAKHGLTDLDEPLEPYDLALSDTTAAYRDEWAREVIWHLTDTDAPDSPAHLTVYAGSAYVNALRAHLPDGWTLDDPMKGLGQGQRLAWLSARRAALTATPAAASSATPTTSAGPVRSAPDSHVATATPVTMSREDRHAVLDAALEYDEALAELAELKARLLAEIDAKTEAFTTQRERLMRCVLTGTSPSAPEQLVLGVDVPPSKTAEAAPAVTTPEGEDEHPEPEPPKGRGTKKSSSSEAGPVVSGEKRLEAVESARAVTAEAAAESVQSAPATQADILPAPGVPCCTCGDSLANHEEGKGPCSRCACTSFEGVPVDLPGAPGWKARPVGGMERARILMGQGKETLPLWWKPKYGLTFREDEILHCVYSYLGERTTTATYEKDPRWNWVPRPALRALAEHLGAVWLEKKSEVEAEPARTGAVPDLDDVRTTAATDGEADPAFKMLDLTALHAVLGQPVPGYHRTYTVRVEGNSPRACEACGTRGRSRAWVHFGSDDRKGKRGAYTGSHSFAMALCVEDCTVAGVNLAWENRAARVEAERTQRDGGAPSSAIPAGQDACPAECDSCGGDFPAAELQPLGPEDARGYYCAGCKAEVDEIDGRDSGVTLSTSPADAPRVDSVPADTGHREWHLSDRITVEVEQAGTPNASLWIRMKKALHGPLALTSSGRIVAPTGTHPAAPLIEWLISPAGRSVCFSVERFLEESEPARGSMAGVVIIGDRAEAAQSEETPNSSQDPDSRVPTATCGALNEKTGERCVDPKGHATGWHHGASAPGRKGQVRWKNEGYRYHGPESATSPEAPAKPKRRNGSRASAASATTVELALSPHTPAPGEATSPAVPPAEYVLLERKGVMWSFSLGAVLGQEVEVSLVRRKSNSGLEIVYTPGRWSLAAGCWTVAPEVPNDVALLGDALRALKLVGEALRAEDSPARGVMRRASTAETPAGTSPVASSAGTEAEPAATSEGWRVELPERDSGRGHILLVWLVNDATGERKAAQWWPSLGKLKCSHHRAGTLKGEAQQEHLELMAWWAVNRDEVVAPLEAQCAEGKVPGLKVYAPELLAPGPHRYALSAPWMLEVWEASAEGSARARFTGPTERGDMAWVSGDFTFKDGLLTTADVPSAQWVGEAGNTRVVQEAEAFIARGLVPELAVAGVAP